MLPIECCYAASATRVFADVDRVENGHKSGRPTTRQVIKRNRTLGKLGWFPTLPPPDVVAGRNDILRFMNQKNRPRSSKPATRVARRNSDSKAAKTKPTKLRIIGGDMRGRPIEYHGADFTRPMKDNIRENLFNILGRAVRGAICFDLFAGTGALAFESLSRGARSAIAIERNRHAIEVIRKTTNRLSLDDRMQILTGDAFKLSSALLVPPPDDTPWIVFVCPPYVLWQESLESLQTIIQSTLDHAPPGSVLVAETEKKFDPDQLPAGDWDLREYGGTRLAFIEPAMRCGLDLSVPEFEDPNG